MPSAGRERRRQKYSFGGCRTCRRRHIKCDKTKPYCLACRTLNLACDGYDSDLRWMPPATLVSAGEGQAEDDSASVNTTRRHLYPIALRASMSAGLRECLGSSSVDLSLSQLEERTQSLQANEGSVSIGPFRVLRMDAAPSEINQAVLTANNSASGQSLLTELSRDAYLSGAVSPPMNWHFPVPGSGKTLKWPDLIIFGINVNDNLRFSYDAGIPQEGPGIFVSDNRNTLSHNLGDKEVENIASVSHLGSTKGLEELRSLENPNAAAGLERHMISLVEIDTVESQMLLKHFHDFLVPSMIPMPSNTKSFWKGLQLNEAVRALSELSYLATGAMNHAKAANLYATLACSAYHLSASNITQTTKEPGYWVDLFARLKDQASVHMQHSVDEEQNSTRKESYKDQLMALLTMITCNTISGHYTIARRYILDAERLIKLKVLKKRRISQKCRALHQIYTWIRIVGESTFVTMDHAHQGPIIANMSAEYGMERFHESEPATGRFPSDYQNTHLDEFLRLDPHYFDSDSDDNERAGPDSSLQHIHIVETHQGHLTTPNEIYGISETWLSLVSQTTRLANMLHAAKSAPDTNSRFLSLLQTRATNLERHIYDWVLKDSDEGFRSSQPANRHMLRAMNSALIILFYRRIRNVDVSGLQRHVDAVLAALLDFDTALASEGLVGPGSPWPAFVAGCEAADHGNRTLLMAWLDRGFDKSGLKPFDTALGVLREVWDRRDGKVIGESSGSGELGQGNTAGLPILQHTWIDVCREKGIWVPLY